MTGVRNLLEAARVEAQAIDARRSELERQAAGIAARIAALPARSAVDGLRAIVVALQERMSDVSLELLGPQGLDCLMSIHARHKGITLASLTFRPNMDDVYSLVDYSRNTGEYPPNSAGARAHANYPDMPIPEGVDDLVGMLRNQMMRRAS